MGILGLVLQEPLMRLLGSTDSILPYAKEYSTWILLAAPAMASSCVMNNILRYEGKAVFVMMGLAFGGILNIFGDAVLIFGLDMGGQGSRNFHRSFSVCGSGDSDQPLSQGKDSEPNQHKIFHSQLEGYYQYYSSGFSQPDASGTQQRFCDGVESVLCCIWGCSNRSYEYCIQGN